MDTIKITYKPYEAFKITYEALGHFKSKRLYRHPFFKDYRYTRGIQFLGENGAHWLINDILAYQQEIPAVQQHSWPENHQFWILEVDEEDSVLLCCQDTTNRVIFARAYRDVDFPLPRLILYVLDNVLMLDSEYPEHSRP